MTFIGMERALADDAVTARAFSPSDDMRYLQSEQWAWVCCSTLLLISFAFVLGNGAEFAFPYLAWMKTFRELGLVSGYYSILDVYPPGTFAALAMAAKLASVLGIGDFEAFKLLQIGGFVATTLIAHAYSRDVVLTVVFQLSQFANSLVFSSVDIWFIPSLILALWALQKGRVFFSAAAFAVTLTFKWQPVFIAPVLLIHVLRLSVENRRKLYWTVAGIAAGLLVPLSIFGPAYILKLFLAGGGSATSYSAWTFNLGWIVGAAVESALQPVKIIAADPQSWPIRGLQGAFAAYLLLTLTVQWRVANSYKSTLIAACGSFAGFVILYPGVHSNYWVTLSALLFLLAAIDRSTSTLLQYVTVMSCFNMLFIYTWPAGKTVTGLVVSVAVSIVNLIVFSLATRLMIVRADPGRRNPSLEPQPCDASCSPSRAP